MILTYDKILEEIAMGRIVADRHMVQENSVNFRLGESLWVPEEDPNEEYINVCAPRSFTEVAPEDVTTAADGTTVCTYLLQPGLCYLGHSLEKIGSRVLAGETMAYVPELRARSTTGRHGLTVACCAGMGDVGYCGQWALEIKNHNHKPVLIRTGVEIGQIVFHTASPVYSQKIYGGEGRYQAEDGGVRFFPKPLR